MALINIGSDPWLSEYESCDRLQREIMEQLSLRSKERKGGEPYIRISAAIRMRLKQFNNELEQLKIKLDLESKTTAITYEESERRSRQIEILRSKNVQMSKLFENNSVVNNVDRGRLLGAQAVQDLGTADWGTEDDEIVNTNFQEQSLDSIRVQQLKMAQDQEKGLEELSKIISRQKNIAETISTEVDLQNELIDDLGDHIDRTDMRVINETQHVQIVDRKDRTCGYWVIIILLFISIVVVAIV